MTSVQQGEDNGDSVAIIRTSDRIAFKSCRRKWGWSSHLKNNLSPKEYAGPLWFGTGMHYAMEDYHGYNVYGTPARAFEAYCIATKACNSQAHPTIPAGYDEFKVLGKGMMEYYLLWLADRDPLNTFWYNGFPQVEVRVLVPIPLNPQSIYPTSPYNKVMYSATIDRVVEDPEDGDLWLLDYKSAAQMQTGHFLTDPQIGAYYWLGHHVYPGRRIKGFLYQQHRKDFPEPPKMLATGKLSTNKQQLTSHRAYRLACVNLYGSDTSRWPSATMEFLNFLAGEETTDYDRYIRRDRIYRNSNSHEAEGIKIILELEDMLNPNLPLYPNPTRDCPRMCSFLHPCVSLDDGGDWQGELEMSYHQRTPQDIDIWRAHLPPSIVLANNQTTPSFEF